MPTRLVLHREHAPFRVNLGEPLVRFVIIFTCMLALALALQWAFAPKGGPATSNYDFLQELGV